MGSYDGQRPQGAPATAIMGRGYVSRGRDDNEWTCDAMTSPISHDNFLHAPVTCYQDGLAVVYPTG